jgi:hypothetical protein
MPKDAIDPEASGTGASDRAALKSDWEETFGSPPPLYLSLGFMQKALAYERQCKSAGGLSAVTRRALAAAMTRGRPRRGATGQRDPGPPVAGAGAVLVREWNGRTYRVEVLKKGYRFDGRTWASLSAIARRITGTSWSGPRFFGLTPKRGG